MESIYPFAEVNALVLEGDSEDYQEKVLINNEAVIVLDAKPGKLVLDVLESYKEWRLLSKPEENIQDTKVVLFNIGPELRCVKKNPNASWIRGLEELGAKGMKGECTRRDRYRRIKKRDEAKEKEQEKTKARQVQEDQGKRRIETEGKGIKKKEELKVMEREEKKRKRRNRRKQKLDSNRRIKEREETKEKETEVWEEVIEEQEFFSGSEAIDETSQNKTSFQRCKKCALFPNPKATHFPHPRFCRWAIEKKKQKNRQINIDHSTLLNYLPMIVQQIEKLKNEDIENKIHIRKEQNRNIFNNEGGICGGGSDSEFDSDGTDEETLEHVNSEENVGGEEIIEINESGEFNLEIKEFENLIIKDDKTQKPKRLDGKFKDIFFQKMNNVCCVGVIKHNRFSENSDSWSVQLVCSRTPGKGRAEGRPDGHTWNFTYNGEENKGNNVTISFNLTYHTEDGEFIHKSERGKDYVRGSKRDDWAEEVKKQGGNIKRTIQLKVRTHPIEAKLGMYTHILNGDTLRKIASDNRLKDRFDPKPKVAVQILQTAWKIHYSGKECDFIREISVTPGISVLLTCNLQLELLLSLLKSNYCVFLYSDFTGNLVKNLRENKESKQILNFYTVTYVNGEILPCWEYISTDFTTERCEMYVKKCLRIMFEINNKCVIPNPYCAVSDMSYVITQAFSLAFNGLKIIELINKIFNLIHQFDVNENEDFRSVIIRHKITLIHWCTAHWVSANAKSRKLKSIIDKYSSKKTGKIVRELFLTCLCHFQEQTSIQAALDAAETVAQIFGSKSEGDMKKAKDCLEKNHKEFECSHCNTLGKACSFSSILENEKNDIPNEKIDEELQIGASIVNSSKFTKYFVEKIEMFQENSADTEEEESEEITNPFYSKDLIDLFKSKFATFPLFSNIGMVAENKNVTNVPSENQNKNTKSEISKCHIDQYITKQFDVIHRKITCIATNNDVVIPATKDKLAINKDGNLESVDFDLEGWSAKRQTHKKPPKYSFHGKSGSEAPILKRTPKKKTNTFKGIVMPRLSEDGNINIKKTITNIPHVRNACYSNCVFQLLYSSNLLREYFIYGQFGTIVGLDAFRDLTIEEGLQQVFLRMQQGITTYLPQACEYVKKIIKDKYNIQIENQNDILEFLQAVLDALEQTSSVEISKTWTIEFICQNTCTDCKTKTSEFTDKEKLLGHPICDITDVSLFQEHLSETNEKAFCENCSSQQLRIQSKQMQCLPPIIFIRMERIEKDEFEIKFKNENIVSIPRKIRVQDDDKFEWILRSVICHYGEDVDRGHFKIITEDDKGFVIIDDIVNLKKPKEFSFEDIPYEIPYLLMYEREIREDTETENLNSEKIKETFQSEERNMKMDDDDMNNCNDNLTTGNNENNEMNIGHNDINNGDECTRKKRKRHFPENLSKDYVCILQTRPTYDGTTIKSMSEMELGDGNQGLYFDNTVRVHLSQESPEIVKDLRKCSLNEIKYKSEIKPLKVHQSQNSPEIVKDLRNYSEKEREKALNKHLRSNKTFFVDKKYEINIDEFKKLLMKDVGSRIYKHWLNDEIINGYLSTISVTGFYFVSSFLLSELKNHNFESAGKLMKNINLRSGKIIIPCNLNDNHWVLCVVDNEKNQIIIYDSRTDYENENRMALKLIKEFINCQRILNSVKFVSFETEISHQCGIQPNGYDCGVYILETARRLIYKEDLFIDPLQLVNIRKHIGISLLENATFK